MSKTAHAELTPRQRQSLLKKFSRWNLFEGMPHVPVKGIEGWPPTAKVDETLQKSAKKKS